MSLRAASRLTGSLNVNGTATFNMGRPTGVTGISGTGTIGIGPTATGTRTLAIAATTPQTFAGKLVDNNATNGLSLQWGFDNVFNTATDPASAITNTTLTLSGANTYSGLTYIYSGTLNLTGSITPAIATGTANPMLRIGSDPIPTGGVRTPTQAAVYIALAHLLPAALEVTVKYGLDRPTTGQRPRLTATAT